MTRKPRIAGRPAGHFLKGDMNWWTPPIGPIWSRSRWKETPQERHERQEVIISAIGEREKKAPSTCSGWQRQRLRPLAISWLFPSSFSLGFGMLAIVILFFDRVDNLWSMVSAQIGLLSCAGSLAFFQWRRIGNFHGINLSIVTTFSLVGTGYIVWAYVQGIEESSSVFAWAILLLVSIVFVIKGGSGAVIYDGGRWLMPIVAGTTVRVDGEEIAWKEGRIFIEKIENETLSLSVEKISGTYFLVLSNSANFNIRKDPLLNNSSKLIIKRAIAVMQSNSSKIGKWPDWALNLTEEE